MARKFQIEGGDQSHRWGGLKILGMGGTGLHGGGDPWMGGGVPPIPPYWTTLVGHPVLKDTPFAIISQSLSVISC